MDFRIGIRFSDNDFITTWIELLNSVGVSISVNASEKMISSLTKQDFVNWFNIISYSYYHTFQYIHHFPDCKMSEVDEHIKDYLKIDISDIYLNEEVDDYVISDDCWNGEFFALDMRLPPEQRVYFR